MTMSKCSEVVLGLTVAMAFSLAPAAARAQDTGKSFVETFDKLDKKRWYISDGWANGDHQNCTWSADQVSIADATLSLGFEAKQTKDRKFACGEIQTNQRFSYGTYEVRMKAVAAPGFNTSFFSYIGPVHKQPWDEIDFEFLGKDMSVVQLNSYVDGKGGNEKLVKVPGGADAGFNDYAFVWEKDRLRFFVNGELVHTVTEPEKLPSHAQKIYLSLWASDTLSSWLGKFSAPAERVNASYKRVSYTALGEACQFPESVACTLK